MKAWAKRNLARTSEVLSDGMPGFRTIGEVVQHHEMKEMPGGWRSAKHLPRYLSEFQWCFNRRFHLEAILVRLLHAAVRTPPMPHKLLVLAAANR